jgi:probable O-glycosylation ligase (exosortase A-associated)
LYRAGTAHAMHAPVRLLPSPTRLGDDGRVLRTIFVLACLAVGFRYAFKGTFYVLLLYLWLDYFRPDQWLWSDFTQPLHLLFLVGVWVAVGMFVSRDAKPPGNRFWLFGAFLAQGLVSTVFSHAFDYSWHYWTEFATVTAICFAILLLVNTTPRLYLTLTVIALSLGFDGAKQGYVNLILHPGGMNTNTSLMFGDNNGVAVGMTMLVPVCLTLAEASTIRWGRWFWWGIAGGTLFRGVFTYSRGGFLAILALGLHYLLRSKRRGVAIVGSALVLGITLTVLPQQFWDRMNTIPHGEGEEAEMDRSSASRLHFWRVAVDMANASPILGVGQNAYNVVYDEFDFSHGEFGSGRSVHSMWFGILAERGYFGFLIFVGVIGGAFLDLWRTRHQANRHRNLPELQELARYSTGIEAALVACAVGGAFVPFQYNEFAWHLMALAAACHQIAARVVTASERDENTLAAGAQNVFIAPVRDVPVQV